ncbi:MAG: alkaline phosphatase [Fervidicoccus fontis]|uniref:DedA family protein n=2 Tax=Fervidicoccus fontis TaxID=683846 RepID=A0A7C2ZR27_9CREN|nr:MAG: alkaline phosphatase [Fervidicoccus fontis]HEW63618.1 DedA family protein [Fervidicoccus fontis]
MKKQSFFIIFALSFLIILTSVYFYHSLSSNSILQLVTNYSVTIISKIGYLGIFFLMTLESALIPIPSEVVMTFSGFLVGSNVLNVYFVLISGTMGNLLGSIILYLVGEKIGLEFLKYYGKYFLIDDSDLDRANRLFMNHGSKIILIGRMLPAIRTVISLPAGLAKMNFKKFSIYTLIGSISWNLMLIYIGIILKDNWEIILGYSKILDYAMIIVLLLLIFLYYYYKSTGKKGGKNERYRKERKRL